MIPIIYEDEDVLVLNKPSGLVVHGDGRTKEETLAHWVLEKYPALRGVGEAFAGSAGVEIPRPGIVHRLDKETSGVILLLKNQLAFLHVKKQFQEHTIVKVYHAFLYGSPKDKQGTISLPIGKSRADFRRRSAEHGASGVLREARTDYRVLARGKDASFVEAKPFTGRTHQVRVHFKAIGHPVVCDKLYAPRRPCILGFSRLALHASSITFVHPRGETLTVEASFPPDFVRAREELER